MRRGGLNKIVNQKQNENVQKIELKDTVHKKRNTQVTKSLSWLDTELTPIDIYIIKEGVVEVEVPYNHKLLHFDYLPPGSCFSVFAPFGLDAQQILNFRAKTNCVIETINVRTDKKLRKKEGAKKEGDEEQDHDKEAQE